MDKKQREALRHRQYRKSKKEDMNKLKTLHAYILRKDSELLKNFEAVTARRVLIVEQNLSSSRAGFSSSHTWFSSRVGSSSSHTRFSSGAGSSSSHTRSSSRAGSSSGHAHSSPFSYPEPFLRAVRRGALAKSITGYHKNMVIEYIRY